MNGIMEFLMGVVSPTQALTLVGLVLANLCTGTLASLIRGDFEMAKFKDFWKQLGTVFVAYVGAGIAAQLAGGFDAVQTTVWAALIAFLASKVYDNLKELGLPIPEKPVSGMVNNVASLIKSTIKGK